MTFEIKSHMFYGYMLIFSFYIFQIFFFLLYTFLNEAIDFFSFKKLLYYLYNVGHIVQTP